jgi:glycine oxidase
LAALASEIHNSSVKWICNAEASDVSQNSVTANSTKYLFDCVIDCRGLGASSDLMTLRGVRGEIIDLHAPDVDLGRPVRLMHPRYPLYIVPRQEKRYLIGATSIECNDTTAVSVQSTLELLSAAFSVHPGFARASIIEMRVNCRPAFSDNLPKIIYRPGLVRVNGLYRHGFLVAPKISELLCEFLETGKPTQNQILAKLFEEESICKSLLTVPCGNATIH